MSAEREWNATIVGSGPNGLTAAAALAEAGARVLVLESATEIGGGARTASLDLDGCLHDLCSAVHPLGAASPAFDRLGLTNRGVDWLVPPVQLAHPFDDGSAATVERSLETTAASLDEDAGRYRSLLAPLVHGFDELVTDVLSPPLAPPAHPVTLARFLARAALPVTRAAPLYFGGHRARALMAGLAAHANMPLHRLPTMGFALLLGAAAHAVGWPLARGGSGAITAALAEVITDRGGEIRTGQHVQNLDQLPPSDAVLLDVSSARAAAIAGDRLRPRIRRRLASFRRGPGVFKLDWVLSEPVPWAADACQRAGTVHLGGTLGEIVESEQQVAAGFAPRRPFTIVAQPGIVDPGRAPTGQQTLWAYCHVPNGSRVDMQARIEAQIERFAPGFRDVVVARQTRDPSQFEAANPNLLGGDISGGESTLPQFLARPLLSPRPYRLARGGPYLCSSSTPPGAGVHGMCGYWAARTASADLGQTVDG